MANLRILCLRNNVTDLNTLNQGVTLATQWCSTIGLTLDFKFVDTTRQFTSVPTSDSTFNAVNGYTVNSQDIMDEANKLYLLPHDINLLVYDASKITPEPTNPSDGGMCVSMPTKWYATYPEVFAQFLLHELCHYYFGLTTLKDTTHLMTNRPMNPTLYDQFSRQPIQNYYLYLLKSFVTPQNAITATLTRDVGDYKETTGNLVLDDKSWGCKTLELPYLANQQNISCVPTGQYLCKFQFMLRDLAYHYCLQNVKGRSGVFIHSGTFAYKYLGIPDTKGCILIGGILKDINGDSHLDLLNSGIILKAFEQKMAGKDFILKIC